LVEAYDHGLFKKLDTFLEEWDNGDIEAKPQPTPSSQIAWQVEVATIEKLTASMSHYRVVTHDYQLALDELKILSQGKQLSKAPTELQEPFMKRLQSAIALEQSIDQARSYGLILPTEQIRTKLKDCEENNRRLSTQILDYKKKLNLA
jgi:hypothetical protein